MDAVAAIHAHRKEWWRRAAMAMDEDWEYHDQCVQIALATEDILTQLGETNMAPPWVKTGTAADARPVAGYTLGPPVSRGEIIGVYGPGGSGKTVNAALSERTLGPVVFIDLDESLGALADTFAELGLSPQGVSGIETWADMIALLKSDALDAFKVIVLDTATRAQDLAMAHVVATVPCEGGSAATSIESYGYGKGYRFLHDAFLDLRAAMYAHKTKGRHFIVNMHHSVATVANPDGPEYLRFEPNLYADKSISLRLSMQNWTDHLLFIGYDVAADAANPRKGIKHGKAKGSGTRTIQVSEIATCMAKSRRLHDPIPYEYGDDALWRALFSATQPKEA